MKQNYILSGLIGLSVGDALGVPVEFKAREYLKKNPVKDMMEYGTHKQPKGTWSDDSSLTFCLSESLCSGYDLRDIGNKFISWCNLAYWTPHGNVFDIGIATSDAINLLKDESRLPESCGGTGKNTNGNGSLMRILPMAFYVKGMDQKEKYQKIKEVSSLTHAHARSIISCCIYIDMAINIINGLNKEESYNLMKQQIKEYFEKDSEYYNFDKIMNKNISKIHENSIKSTGYVIDTLEAAFWCFMTEESFEKSVLKAVNLGGDTDTIGAVTGGLAGLYYGFDKIPESWVNTLAKKDKIIDLADRLYGKLES